MGTLRRRLVVIPRLIAALLLLGGCAVPSSAPLTPGDSGPSSAAPSATPPSSPNPVGSPTTTSTFAPVDLVGRLDRGVERCIVLRTDDGKTYEMMGGDPSQLVVGERVRVRGVIRTDAMSYCMQGPIVQVFQVQPA